MDIWHSDSFVGDDCAYENNLWKFLFSLDNNFSQIVDKFGKPLMCRVNGPILEVGFKRFWKIHYGLIVNGAQISFPGMMTGTKNLNVSLTMNSYLSFYGILDLYFSNMVLLFASKVFSLACWVALDELLGSVETLVVFVDNDG